MHTLWIQLLRVLEMNWLDLLFLKYFDFDEAQRQEEEE